MNSRAMAVVICAIIARILALGLGPVSSRAQEREPEMILTHKQTLDWICRQRAWRVGKKTKPIWVRPVLAEEVGKEFQTADHVAQVAKQGFWLCVGVAGEPWFQDPEKVLSKYDPAAEEEKEFEFDPQPRAYRVYRPKPGVRNWVAQVQDPGIRGFHIKPNYDPDRPLYSPAGGYVVKDFADDPYQGGTDDVWLVQEGLFDSTYELDEAE